MNKGVMYLLGIMVGMIVLVFVIVLVMRIDYQSQSEYLKLIHIAYVG